MVGAWQRMWLDKRCIVDNKDMHAMLLINTRFNDTEIPLLSRHLSCLDGEMGRSDTTYIRGA